MSCWSYIDVQLINDYETKNYDHNFILDDFREKNRIFRKDHLENWLKHFFSIKDINLIFHTDFLDIKA